MSYTATRLSGTTEEGYIPFKYNTKIKLEPGKYKWVASYEYNTPKKSTVHKAIISTEHYNIVESKNKSKSKMVGGIRIKEIENFDANGTQIDKRIFSYTKDDGESSGVAGPKPCFVRHYIESYTHDVTNGFAGVGGLLYVGIEEIGEENLCKYSGSAVLYTDVTEYRTIGSETLKVRYHYNQAAITLPTVHSKTFKNDITQHRFSETGYREGLLSEEIIFKNEGTTSKPYTKTKNWHMILERKPFVHETIGISLQNIFGYDAKSNISTYDQYFVGTYKLVSAWVNPTQTVTYQYIGSDSITTTTVNHFENNKYLLPTMTEKYVNSSEKIITENKYCFDYPNDSNMSLLKRKNIISKPVKVTTNYGNNTTTTVTNYSQFDRLVKPSCAFYVNNGDTIKIDYLAYDSYGNILHAKMNNKLSKIYIWSYCGRLPIAEISGGDYTFEQVNAAVTSVFNIGIKGLSDKEVPNTQALQSGKLQKMLPNANVSTFTFDNYTGVATITNTNGTTTTYEYDDFERLSAEIIPIVKNGNDIGSAISKSYKYNYQGISQ